MFPLFQFPFLAQEEILSTMEATDLCRLAMASKRAKRLVASCTKKGRYTLSIDLDTEILLTVSINGVCSFFKLSYKKPVNYGPLEKEDMNRVLKHSDFLRDIFHCKITSVYIDTDLCIGHVKQIVDWLLKYQETIERLVYQGISFVGQEFAYLLEKCVATKFFRFSMVKFANAPRPNHPRFGMDYLRIDDSRSSWITLDDILSFDCVCMRLSTFQFNENDMNRFLKAWINGSNSRMRFLEIEIPYLDHAEVIDGLALEEFDVVLKFRDPEGYPSCLFEGGTHIRRRSDGQVAVFQQESPYYVRRDGNLGLKRFSPFRMLVWGG